VSGSASSALPGRKLATSIKPRMLTPSEIDLLRQDLQAALKLLGQDEIDDAHGLLREHGFRPADFEIVRHAHPDPLGAITGRVTLLRKSTHMAKTYEAGPGTSWRRCLENDLQSWAFGPL
jgi:hypothetical protein